STDPVANSNGSAGNAFVRGEDAFPALPLEGSAAGSVLQSLGGVILAGSGRKSLNVLVAISNQASAIRVSTFHLTADR
ncbi:MAG: hypothetical protein JW751_26120, partial [Polyangiaceae bacterium]|nr:hypothetical protein [Polyangiaceae bacterium]